jgi:hypothetical protein
MVMIDFFGALRRGELEAAAELLDPDVSRQGLREEWVCHGRQEVIDTFHWGIEQRREIDGLEPWARSSTSSRCAMDGSSASTTTAAAGALTAAGVGEDADWR